MKEQRTAVQKTFHTIYCKSLDAMVDRLFAEAAKHRLTWEEMAKLSGLSKETVRRLGNRLTQYPQFRTVELLAHALGGRLDYLAGVERRASRFKWTPKVFNGRSRKAVAA